MRQAEEAPGFLEHVGEIAQAQALADDVEEIATGAFADLLAGTPSEDFVQAILTDETPLIDPMKRLRATYPNACHLAYARQTRVSEAKTLGAGRAAVTPIEMVGDFLKAVRGQEPSDNEVAIVADRLHAADAAEDRA